MRALAFSLILLGGCTGTPELESGDYQVSAESGKFGGARIHLDAAAREITLLGGCSADFIVYRLDGARLNVVEEDVTAEACPDGGPYADDVNNRVSELLNQRPRVSATGQGFNLSPATGGPPVSFVRMTKNAQS